MSTRPLFRSALLALPALLLALPLALGAAGCERTAPSPWREMKFPLRHGEVLAGSDERQLIVEYKGIAQHEELLREFGQTLERQGYSQAGEGKEHDPPGNTHALIYTKGAEEVLLTVSGRGNTSVRVRKL